VTWRAADLVVIVRDGTSGPQVPRHGRPATVALVPALDPPTVHPTPSPAALADLLGALAYGELTAFQRLAGDSVLAESVADAAALAAMAAAEYGHHARLVGYLSDRGIDPEAAMAPFVAPLNAFHLQTAPADWLQSLVKAYVGDGIGTDFYREVAGFVDPETRALIEAVSADTGHAAFAVEHVRAAIALDPRLSGRLALWARRLVGEALTQAQRVAVERDALTELLGEATDLAGIGAVFERILAAHEERMRALGLA
jgi:hypothetical protein